MHLIEKQPKEYFNSTTQAWINTVNCVSVAGKGLALAFREQFPSNYQLYKDACKNGDVQIGKMFITENTQDQTPKYIINFPTKQHWSNPSKLRWIELGLMDLVEKIQELNITSISVPALGCSNGKLRWEQVKPLIIQYLEPIENLTVELYSPWTTN